MVSLEKEPSLFAVQFRQDGFKGNLILCTLVNILRNLNELFVGGQLVGFLVSLYMGSWVVVVVCIIQGVVVEVVFQICMHVKTMKMQIKKRLQNCNCVFKLEKKKKKKKQKKKFGRAHV
eukprot:TRINITY_DN3123_c0_g2_i2.p4 TRINITY_DN3123_c0_g2~~TRINITY_DN3123_c0_g2_i2.p4  ORF type:complete len:119 (-),score=18.08 TRINITY_DN3123_c0_g2_i2:49-405(-)